jgi:hypothetical protein
MALSKKHYERIAAILNSARAEGDVRLPSTQINEETRRDTVRSIANELSIHFKLDNNAFDKARFLRACGF